MRLRAQGAEFCDFGIQKLVPGETNTLTKLVIVLNIAKGIC